MDHDDAMRMLKAITTAFDEHDLEGIMAYFTDDAVFEGPRGADPWGTRFVGKHAVREGFAARFAGIPDIRYHLWTFRDGKVVKKDSYWKIRPTG